MPLLNDENMTSQAIGGSNYGYSAARIDTLGASEYTLVTLAVDVSGSVAAYRAEMEAAIKEIVEACRQSPRADNLLLRMVTFDTKLDETHGFKPLSQCNPADYDNSLRAGGMTALFDASFNAIEASNQYGHDLTAQDFDCNAIVFVITDGADNASTLNVGKVRESLQMAVQGEHVESMVSVLVGVGAGGSLSSYLQKYKDDAGFTQYVALVDALAKTLARLAAFVSKSISAQSQSLGTGGASQSLSF